MIPKKNQSIQFTQNKEEDQEIQLKLLKIIPKFQKLIDKFNKHKKQNMSVVLIVGVTGSGKSTFFNFLGGADFIINVKYELEIKNPQNHFSKMASGMNSVTKKLHFYYNQGNNHLIIDFPGFQDTKGKWDQLLFELLFYKIVTSGPLKIIYVINNPQNNLPNRGTDLQEFISQLCQKGNINIQKFTLLLNCYMDNLNDTQLQKKIKEDLKSVNILQSIDKILVLRKAKKDDELQQIFNDHLRQDMWNHIQQIQSFKIQPQKLSKTQIISEIISNSILQTIERYGIMLTNIFDQYNNKLSWSQNQIVIPLMKQLLNLVDKDKIQKESSLEWYTKYIQTCEQLANTLKIKDEIVTRSNNFITIFTYYSQFSNIIQGYDDLRIFQIITGDKIKNMNNLIGYRLEIVQKQEQIKVMQIQQAETQQQLNSLIIQKEQDKKEFDVKIQQLNSQQQKQIESLLDKINIQNENLKQMEKKNDQLYRQIYYLENKSSSCQIF